MTMFLRGVMLSAALISAGAAPSSADQKCQLLQYASLDMGTDPTGGVYVPVMINGQKENLLMETGSFMSMLTQTTVQELSLKHETLSGRMTLSMPGARIKELVHADTVQLGTMKASHVSFLVMPDGRMPSEVHGTLGRDFMANYDVEFDFAKGKINVFSPEQCDGQVVYWTHEPYAKIPFKYDSTSQMSTTVQLDGKSINATISTGFSRSMMEFDAARDLFGWDDTTAGLTVVSKTPDDTPATYHYPFKTFSLSGVAVGHPEILLVRSSDNFQIASPGTPIVIGLDVLRQLHLYVAYQERTIYATSAEAH